MKTHTLIGVPIEANGFNAQAIGEIESIYNRFSEMHDCTRAELYAMTAISVAVRNYSHNTKAERCPVNITVWDINLSLTTNLVTEVRMAAQAINSYITQVSQTQTDREVIWQNVLLFCYQLNS